MIKKTISIGLAAIILSMSSCASIVSKSSYPVSITSDPAEAKITIIDKKGNEIYQGKTPAEVSLKSGAGFFAKASYTVKFEKEGYESAEAPISFKLDGWYFGNILIGGLIGLLIVDPATGAMYKLEDEYVSETLKPVNLPTATINDTDFYDIDTIPSQWKAHLVRVN